MVVRFTHSSRDNLPVCKCRPFPFLVSHFHLNEMWRVEVARHILIPMMIVPSFMTVGFTTSTYCYVSTHLLRRVTNQYRMNDRSRRHIGEIYALHLRNPKKNKHPSDPSVHRGSTGPHRGSPSYIPYPNKQTLQSSSYTGVASVRIVS